MHLMVPRRHHKRMSLVKSKQRVADYGEVFTPRWLVEDMLNLVQAETERIDSRFLEPACGSGNFLIPVLERKLAAVQLKYGNSDFEKKHYALLGLRCIYGIELLADNVEECRENLLATFTDFLEVDRTDVWARAASVVVHVNIVQGDALVELVEENRHFDVVIGNPPYHRGSDGGTRYMPIYQHFVEQAKKLEPRYLSMIIQSRWMTSGLGLSQFRDTMLHDSSLKSLVDYPNAVDVFPGTGFSGGVCYFLRDSFHDGRCEVTTVRSGVRNGPVVRELSEFDVFVRDVRAVSILKKILNRGEPSITTILSADKEFGWTSNFRDFHSTPVGGEVPIYYVDKRDRKVGSISRTAVGKSVHLIDTWKVMVPKAGSGGDTVPDYVLGRPLIAPSPSVCTQTFLFFHLPSEEAAVSLESYLKTRFARFLISLRKITQDATKSTYTWVPVQEWDRPWHDEELYEKYEISKDEIDYIESMIRPMASNYN